MTLGQGIRNGVKWLAFGKVGNRLFEFAFGIALARLLVPADFGMIATIQIFTGFVGMFVAGGMGQSLIRAKQVDQNDFNAVFTLQLAVGILVYIVFFTTAPLVARLFEDPRYTDLIRVSTLSFLLRPLVTMRNAWLNREMNFKSRTLVDVATGFFGGFISVVMAMSGMGVWSLTVSGLLGALFNNLWLSRLTPLNPRLNLNIATMRKHAGYGAKIVGNDIVNYLHSQSRTVILSKMAGPAFLGLFNKSESLARLPNQLLMSPTMEPLFRALSKTQDDLDQTKYLFYRAVTLLMAYTTPAYVLMWWIAERFIGVVYGPNGTSAGAPMSILTAAGIFLNVVFPCSAVLAAQNRLGKEMLAAAINLPILAGACIIGLQWGLAGVAWGVVLAQSLFAVQLYGLVLRAIPTRLTELVHAVSPGLLLGTLLFSFLALIDQLISSPLRNAPGAYMLVMAILAFIFYAALFLLLPMRALESEAARCRKLAAGSLTFLRRRRP